MEYCIATKHTHTCTHTHMHTHMTTRSSDLWGTRYSRKMAKSMRHQAWHIFMAPITASMKEQEWGQEQLLRWGLKAFNPITTRLQETLANLGDGSSINDSIYIEIMRLGAEEGEGRGKNDLSGSSGWREKWQTTATPRRPPGDPSLSQASERGSLGGSLSVLILGNNRGLDGPNGCACSAASS